ncbi:MAG: hypothetical protein F4Y05_04895 [Acidimicrobiaceae bacterium]|nr:hypothetical protein [Acidimicrobiaceae bacterium]
MENESSLLAYLAPRLTSPGEDTATDALAFILNKSEACCRALESLLSDQDFAISRLTRFQTQVTYEDGSRPDMVGYDGENRKRLLVESKFWAALRDGQASRYFGQLEQPGPGLLLFIVPGSRIETLWPEIRRQMETGEHSAQLQSEATLDRMRRARVASSENRLMLVSWDLLLERLVAAVPADSQVASDVQQLRGFVEEQDLDAFQPLQREELSPSLARRVLSLERLINDVVARGDERDWMSQGKSIKYEEMCFGRYFGLRDGHGEDMWLGAQFWMWARRADTPLWLWIDSSSPISAHQLRSLENPIDVFEEDDGLYVPIRLLVGVEYHHVLDDVVDQLRRIAAILVA